MKKNEKIFVGAIALIAIIIIAGLLIARNSRRQQTADNGGEDENYVEEEFVELLEDGTKLNTSEQMKTTKRVEGVEISNIQVTEKDNATDILGTATNVTNQVQPGFSMDIKILDKEGNEIATIGGLVGELQPGESVEFHSSGSLDFANAYDFTVVKTGDYVR